MRSVILLFLCAAFVYADVVDKVVKQVADSVDASKGGKVRQCTCTELHDCMSEYQAQGKECMESCVTKLKDISKDTNELRECFHEADTAIGSAITCVEKEGIACSNEKTDKQVDKVDLKLLIAGGTQKLLTLEKDLTKIFPGEVRHVFDTLTGFGVCIKDCVLEKNSGGFCFEKKGCQPDLKEMAKKTAKKCAQKINFQKYAGDICECAKTKAKGNNLNKFCPLVKIKSA